MYHEWSLDALYTGLDDPALQEDVNRLEACLSRYREGVAALPDGDPAAALRRVVDAGEEMAVLHRRLSGYFFLRRSTNSSDAEGAKYMTKIQAMTAGTAQPRFRLNHGSIFAANVTAPSKCRLLCSAAGSVLIRSKSAANMVHTVTLTYTTLS